MRLAAVACLASCALAGPLAAIGDGTLADGKLELLVYFVYDEDAPEGWQAVFDAYSLRLANATEDAVQLGRVSFTVCDDLREEADVWILSDSSGARAHLNGLGVAGRHITISQLHESTSGFALGQFGLTHESGHYVWGTYDEYTGLVDGQPTSDSGHFCVSSSSRVACIMDGGSTVVPNNQRTEFCTRTNLNFATTRHYTGATSPAGGGIVTNQQHYLAEACWETIEGSGRGGLVHPASDPSTVQPATTKVEYDYSRYVGTLGMALVLDTSGSMSDDEKIESAIAGAQSSVGLLLDGEFLAVVAFDDVPSVIFAAQAMTSARKDQAIAAIGALTAEGGTVIGTALLAAEAELGRVEACNEFVVLVSDGLSDAPGSDDPAVVAALQAAGIEVFSIALGLFPDESGMQAVACATGGLYFRAYDAAELPGIFATIFAVAGGGTVVGEGFQRGLDAGEEGQEAFEVGAAAEALRVSLAFPAATPLDLELVAPDGTHVLFLEPPAGGTNYASAGHKMLVVPQPLSGPWTVLVRGATTVPTSYDLLAFVDAREVLVSLAASAEVVTFPDPMHVTASVVSGVPVAGAIVSGSVRRPDGSREPVELFDDGSIAHGDERALDGVYSTLFSRYAGDGSYAFELAVDATDGQAASNLECGTAGFGEEGLESGATPAFRATATRTLRLVAQLGAPAPGSAELRGHSGLTPATDVEVEGAPPTPLGGFELDVAPDEPLLLERLELPFVRHAGSSGALVGLALRLDEDADGRVDSPSIPLASGRVEGDRLVFEAAGAPLVWLAADARQAFLITVGDAPVALGGTLAPRVPTGWGRAPNALLPVALGLLLLALAWRRWPDARRRGALAAGALAALGACHSRAVDGGSFTLDVSAQGVQAMGAVTGEPASVGGEALRFTFRLR
jgi:hypothetical protein